METRAWNARITATVAIALVFCGALFVYDQRLLGLAVTFPCFVIGAVGVLRRQITLGGRGGRNPRRYTGLEAVFASLPFLVLGGALTLWQAAAIWPRIFGAFIAHD